MGCYILSECLRAQRQVDPWETRREVDRGTKLPPECGPGSPQELRKCWLKTLENSSGGETVPSGECGQMHILGQVNTSFNMPSLGNTPSTIPAWILSQRFWTKRSFVGVEDMAWKVNFLPVRYEDLIFNLTTVYRAKRGVIRL